MTDAQFNYLGTGLSFPLKLDSGSLVLESGVELIRASINHILAYEFPRYFRPDFYNKLWTIIDEPHIVASNTLIRIYIIEAIKKFETRVELQSVEVYTDYSLMKVEAMIKYSVKGEDISDTIILKLTDD